LENIEKTQTAEMNELNKKNLKHHTPSFEDLEWTFGHVRL